MYLLILYAFLHADKPAEHVVVGHYRDLASCLVDAGKANVPKPLFPRQPGDVFVCARIEYPT